MTATDRSNQRLWLQNYLRIINVYGSSEAYIVNKDTAGTER